LISSIDECLGGTVLAHADVRTDQRQTLGRTQGAHALHQLRLGKVGVRVADRCEQLVLGIGVPVDQLHTGGRLDGSAAEQ